MAETQEKLSIRQAEPDDTLLLWSLVEEMGQIKDVGYFERQMEYQDKGMRQVLITCYEGQEVGYGILNWQPKYAFFKKLGIPEIQDLNVLSAYRKRGIATGLIEWCEAQARERGHKQMGISVGLSSSFGPAQILYVKLGYIPDGNGVTCDRQHIAHGEIRPVDDQMCLMMVKDLK